MNSNNATINRNDDVITVLLVVASFQAGMEAGQSLGTRLF